MKPELHWCCRGVAVAVLLAVTGGCRKPVESGKPLPAVTVSHPVLKPVTENLDLTGTVAASRSVNLVARVSGFLESVNFKDGDLVEAGQLLFVIEPAPYQQQLALNEAALVQAESEYARQQELLKQNATAISSVEKQ
jgi:multidrug efflux pump subunit AcrA (membrane-fusion protein)